MYDIEKFRRSAAKLSKGDSKKTHRDGKKTSYGISKIPNKIAENLGK